MVSNKQDNEETNNKGGSGAAQIASNNNNDVQQNAQQQQQELDKRERQPEDTTAAAENLDPAQSQQHQTELFVTPSLPKHNAGRGAPLSAALHNSPAADKESEQPPRRKRGRPTSYSKTGGGNVSRTVEEIKEATRATRMERKRFQEKRRRKEFREALETLLTSLICQDKDFEKESQMREARMHGQAQCRLISDDNLVFTRVEMVNQSIYTIERLTLEGQELKKTLAALGGGGLLQQKFGHKNDSRGSPIFNHGVGLLAIDKVPPVHPPPSGMTVTPQPVNTNDRLKEAKQQDFQKRAHNLYFPSFTFQQQQEQQLLLQQQQQTMLIRQALSCTTMLPRPTTGFGVALPDTSTIAQDIPNNLLSGRTHMENAAAMLMLQQQQELMLNEQRKTLLLEQQKRQNPQASIGDLQTFLSSVYSTPNVPNAEGLLPDYNPSSFMSTLAAGNKSLESANPTDPKSVDVLVQQPLSLVGDESVNSAGGVTSTIRSNNARIRNKTAEQTDLV